ncbi:MAG: PilN domain-containing protein [Candidatus Saccharibacteria bacterium]
MINLLPPSIKEQRRYAQINRKLVKIIWLVVILIAAIGAVFAYSWYALGQNIERLDDKLAQDTSRSKKYGAIEINAKALAERLNTIEKIQAERSNYIALLQELAAVTPTDVYVNTFALDTTAGTMNLTAFAQSEQAAANFKNAIESSARFRSAAIQALTPDKDPYSGQSTYRLTLTVGLKDGALK